MATGVAPHPVIGIIGGTGPDATIDPMRRVLEYPMAPQTASVVRCAAFVSMRLSLAKTCSMGFNSGEHLGRKKSLAPRQASMLNRANHALAKIHRTRLAHACWPPSCSTQGEPNPGRFGNPSSIQPLFIPLWRPFAPALDVPVGLLPGRRLFRLRLKMRYSPARLASAIQPL